LLIQDRGIALRVGVDFDDRRIAVARVLGIAFQQFLPHALGLLQADHIGRVLSQQRFEQLRPMRGGQRRIRQILAAGRAQILAHHGVTADFFGAC